MEITAVKVKRQMLSNEHVLWWMRQHPRMQYDKWDVDRCPLALYMRHNGFPRAQWGTSSGTLDISRCMGVAATPDNQAFADEVLFRSIFGFNDVPQHGVLAEVATVLAWNMKAWNMEVA
jgi:hypothetical protein